MAAITRNDDGSFPAYAWPGGYPIYYVVEDGGVLCAPCANRENGSLAFQGDAGEGDGGQEDCQWRMTACGVHWEGEAMVCDHCGAGIKSAYGKDDADQGGLIPAEAGYSASHATMRPEDLIPCFAGELEALIALQTADNVDERWRALLDCAAAFWFEESQENAEAAHYLLEKLFDALNEFAPAGHYFGSHPGDGSDYGFWACEDNC